MVSEDFRTPIDTLEKGRATLPKKGEKGFQSANVSENFCTHEKGRATDKVAKEVGFGSGRQYEKAKKVYEEAPEPIKKQWQEGKLSTHAAYQKISCRALSPSQSTN